jgi:hypothetical protein
MNGQIGIHARRLHSIVHRGGTKSLGGINGVVLRSHKMIEGPSDINGVCASSKFG